MDMHMKRNTFARYGAECSFKHCLRAVIIKMKNMDSKRGLMDSLLHLCLFHSFAQALILFLIMSWLFKICTNEHPHFTIESRIFIIFSALEAHSFDYFHYFMNNFFIEAFSEFNQCPSKIIGY